MKLLHAFFYVCRLFGVIPTILAAFNIFKEQYQTYQYIFVGAIIIGSVGIIVMPKIQTKMAEREMRNMK